MKTLTYNIFLLVLLSRNEANTINNVYKRNTDDSFHINIGAGYGFGSGQTSFSLPRSTTKINHSTSYLTKRLEDELTINQNNNANVQLFQTPNTPEVQESVKTIVTEKPYSSSWNDGYQSSPYQVKNIMNMRDIQKVLHNLDDRSEYSKVVQVLKVPAIYEIHLENRQKNNDPDHKQKEFVKTTPKHVPRTNNGLKNQNVETADVIYGNGITGFTDFANIDDWLQKSTGNLHVEENVSAKVTSGKVGQLNYHNRPLKPTWSPFIESGISGSSYVLKKPQKPNKNFLYHSQITETNSKVPLVYSPKYTVHQKTTNPNVPIASNAVSESTRNIYNVAPFNQPQAMYEVAPPALGKKPIYNNLQGPRPVLTLYSTLSPVLPYDLKTSHSTTFFRNTQRSGSSIEDGGYSNQNVDQFERRIVSSPNAINIPVKPGLTNTIQNQVIDRSDLNRNCRGRFGFLDASNQEIRASSRIDNIYLTTDRPERRSISFISKDSEYMIPGIFKSRSVNRRSGEPLKYLLYVNEKYSDEDDRK